MKIAACFAGQPRFINECAPSILENVFKDQDVDVFAHLWFGEDLTSKEADGKLKVYPCKRTCCREKGHSSGLDSFHSISL